jgi:hypothetical protein
LSFCTVYCNIRYNRLTYVHIWQRLYLKVRLSGQIFPSNSLQILPVYKTLIMWPCEHVVKHVWWVHQIWYHHEIAEILLKVALNTIKSNQSNMGRELDRCFDCQMCDWNRRTDKVWRIFEREKKWTMQAHLCFLNKKIEQKTFV